MIAERTGWSYKEILWGTSWLNFKMMLADAHRMKKIKPERKKTTIIQGDELAKELGLL